MGRAERYKQAEEIVLNELANLKPNESDKRAQLYAQLRNLKQAEQLEVRNKQLPPPRVTKEKKLSRFAQSQKERRQRNMEARGPIGPRAVAWSSLTAPKQEEPPVESAEAMATDTPPAFPAPLSEPASPLPEASQQPPERPKKKVHNFVPKKEDGRKMNTRAKLRKLAEQEILKRMVQDAVKESTEKEDDFEDY